MQDFIKIDDNEKFYDCIECKNEYLTKEENEKLKEELMQTLKEYKNKCKHIIEKIVK